jgi:hypothetical protein
MEDTLNMNLNMNHVEQMRILLNVKVATDRAWEAYKHECLSQILQLQVITKIQPIPCLPFNADYFLQAGLAVMRSGKCNQ